jgi:hypothetical protein
MSYVEPDPRTAAWADRLARWSGRLRSAHLDGLVSTFLEAAEPLSPLGAQFLWIAQPALGLFVQRDDLASLARLLDEPGGMAWLREQLVESDGEARE